MQHTPHVPEPVFTADAFTPAGYGTVFWGSYTGPTPTTVIVPGTQIRLSYPGLYLVEFSVQAVPPSPYGGSATYSDAAWQANAAWTYTLVEVSAAGTIARSFAPTFYGPAVVRGVGIPASTHCYARVGVGVGDPDLVVALAVGGGGASVVSLTAAGFAYPITFRYLPASLPYALASPPSPPSPPTSPPPTSPTTGTGGSA